MKPTEMKARCAICKHYRLITYAAGNYAIGCMKASKDGEHPVDIYKLDRCPREHAKKRFNKVESSELLPVLGKIYAETSASNVFLPLVEMLRDAGPTVRRKSQYLAKALVAMDILKVISRSEKGFRGTRCIYRWNIKAGPPSLKMVDDINAWLKECNEKLSAKKYQQEAEKEQKGVSAFVMDQGTTVCEQCWMRSTPDCYSKLKMMGIDCKKVNLNTIRYAEASMG